MADDRDYAERVAHIMGPWSGAAAAIREANERTASGENVGIWLQDRMWIVGPVPQETMGS